MKIIPNHQDYTNIPSVEIRYSQMIRGLWNVYKDNLDVVLKRYVGVDIKKPKETILDPAKYSCLMNFYELHQRKWTIDNPDLPGKDGENKHVSFV